MSSPLFLSGIASGIDTYALTEAIIAQYRAPVDALENRRNLYRATKSAYERLDKVLGELATVIDGATGVEGPLPLKTETSDNITATSANDAETGSVEFTVDQLAYAQSTSSDMTYAAADADTSTETLTFTAADGTVTEITGATLTELRDNFNAAELGATARIVEASPGQFVMQVTADDTGTDAAFTLTGTDSSYTTNRAAQNAKITIDGLQLTRQTNTFDNVMQGTSVTVKATGAATLTVDTDTEASEARVKKLVDAFNAVIDLFNKDAAPGGEDSRRGSLAGEQVVRSLAFDLRNTVAAGHDPGDGSGAATFSEIGISLTNDGKIKFSASDLKDALAADPDRVATFTQAFAEKLDTIVSGAADAGGSIARATDSLETSIKRADDRIADMERLIDKRRETLRKRFAALEMLTAQLQSQATQMMGALAFPAPSSGGQ